MPKLPLADHEVRDVVRVAETELELRVSINKTRPNDRLPVDAQCCHRAAVNKFGSNVHVAECNAEIFAEIVQGMLTAGVSAQIERCLVGCRHEGNRHSLVSFLAMVELAQQGHLIRVVTGDFVALDVLVLEDR